MFNRIRFSLLAAIAASTFLSACSSSSLIGNPQFPYPLKSPAEVGQIVHMPTGILVSENVMLEIAVQNRIVYVGETHDNPASHRLQLTMLKAMAERYPGKVALGMEMFTPAQNEALRKWVAGGFSEKEFLRAAKWYSVWKGDFEHYKEILYYARENKIPVIGLNAEKETVRLVVGNKSEDLPDEEQRIVSQMDLDDPYQRGMVEGIYGGHVKSAGMLDGFHRAQTLWDETMADSVVQFLRKDEYQDYNMVIIAGGNHVRYGFGIPRRVFRQLPLSYTLIGGKEIEIPESKQDRLMDVNLPQFPMVPYEFIQFTRYEELENEGVKLGVMFNDDDGQVAVQMVSPASNAERAGIEKGDIILEIDGEPVRDNFDLVYAIKQRKVGDTGSVTVMRNEKSLRLDVTYQEKTEPHHGSHKKQP